MMSKLDELTYFVWNEYYKQLEARLGYRPKLTRDNPWGHKYEEQFRKIAELCTEHKLSPVDLLASTFVLLDRSEISRVTPKLFANMDAVRRCTSKKDFVVNAWITHTNSLIDMACRLIPSKYKDELAILMDHNTPFPAWFRLMYVKPFNSELCDRFGQFAHTDLKEDRYIRLLARKHSEENVKELERRFGQFGDIYEVINNERS